MAWQRIASGAYAEVALRSVAKNIVIHRKGKQARNASKYLPRAQLSNVARRRLSHRHRDGRGWRTARGGGGADKLRNMIRRVVIG